jgi:hypothetical protein
METCTSGSEGAVGKARYQAGPRWRPTLQHRTPPCCEAERQPGEECFPSRAPVPETRAGSERYWPFGRERDPKHRPNLLSAAGSPRQLLATEPVDLVALT